MHGAQNHDSVSQLKFNFLSKSLETDYKNRTFQIQSKIYCPNNQTRNLMGAQNRNSIDGQDLRKLQNKAPTEFHRMDENRILRSTKVHKFRHVVHILCKIYAFRSMNLKDINCNLISISWIKLSKKIAQKNYAPWKK